MFLLALLFQSPDSLPSKPPPAPPAAWLALIGAYASGGDTFYVFEDRGALAVLVKLSPPTRLAQPPESIFTLHRLAMRWSRVDNPRAFCRRVMHNIVIDQARARKRRPRELFAVVDDQTSRTRRRARCSRRPSSTRTVPRAPTCTCR